ncbi:ABC transporter permease [Terriglobus albidus]|uniref:ABC transporter permease n=1 Tax=Terriglobus albidus TaxID=1592106 RepID=A0A5B9EB48_9BACT|nr:ABC transporter permease [Terriglobus albidus]QEE28989.1 ABC transporter permease [Terriglobus albidus]
MLGLPLITLGQDLRFALRQLRRAPGFTATAIGTLGLAMGATLTMAGIANSTLLAPLPYPESDRLVGVAFTFPQERPNNEQTGSAADFLSAHAKSFSSMGLTEDSAGGANLWIDEAGSGRAVQVGSQKVTRGYFPALGVQPQLGRNFSEAEDRPGGPKVVLLSERLWRSAFAGSTDVVGRVVHVNGESYTVTGVMQPSPKDQGYSAPGVGINVDLWLPMQLSPKDPGYGGDNYTMVARLKQGVTLSAAQQELNALKEPFYQENPQYRAWTTRSKLLHDFKLWPLKDVEVSHLQSSVLALTGAVLAVLLAACLNLAGLMTARGLRRGRELAVRSSLGATRTGLLRLLLSESVLIATAGIALGMLLSRLMVPALTAASPIAIPTIETDLPLLTLLVGLLLGTLTVAFSLLPAMRVLQGDKMDALRNGHVVGTTKEKATLEKVLVVAQVAVATVLLAVSSLMMGSFLKLRSTDTGFKPQQLVIAQVTLKGDGYAKTEPTTQFIEEVMRRLGEYPGVTSVAAINGLPLDRGLNAGVGPADRPELRKVGELRLITPGYIPTMGIPLAMGRDLSESDGANAVKVVLISATAAKHWWPNRSAIGEQVNMGGKKPDLRTVVGIVGDVHTNSLADLPRPVVYVPFSQAGDGLTKVVNGWFPTTFTVRMATHQDSAKILAQAVSAADPTIPVARVKTMQAMIDSTMKAPRFFSWMAAAFAGFALLLTAIGLFGLLSYQVSLRLREIGVRLAVGASRGQVLRLFLGRGLALTATGLVLGIAASFALPQLIGSLMEDFVYSNSTSPTALLSSTSVAMAVTGAGMVMAALAASYLPARRAALTEPTTILRAE